MTKKEVAALACRMLALFFIVDTFISFANFYLAKLLLNLFGQVPLDFIFNDLPNPLEIFLGIMLAPIILAVILWFFADWFGKKIIREKDHQTKISLSSAEVQSVFITTIGLLFVLGSLIQLVHVFLSPILFKEQYLQPWHLQFLPILFEFFIGGLLVYKAKNFADLLQRKNK